MSQYAASRYDDDEPRRYHSTRTRPRERDEPDYVREDVYIERGKGPGPRELVYRGRDDSVEDIPRNFPPPGRDARSSYGEDYGPRRARSARGGRYDDDYDDDRYSEYTAPAAAGAAGYAAGRRRERERRRRDDREYVSEYSRSPSPARTERRKSGVEGLLGGLGLGGLAGAVLGNKDKSRDRSDSRDRRSARSRSRRRGHSSDEYSRSRSRGPGGKAQNERKWAQAAQAALIAGAVEAFRARKEPGTWTGDKGKRIATAAIGAGGIDGLLDRNPDKKTKRHLAEAVIGGLAANRVVNGPRSKSRGPGDRAYSPDGSVQTRGSIRSRSRSIIDRFRARSQSRGRSVYDDEPPQDRSNGGGAVKGLVAGGALAAAGKAIYDRVRSKSRKRNQTRDRDSSADSYVPSRARRRDRRRSPPSDTDAQSTHRSHAGTDRGRARDTSGDNNNAGALVAGGAGGAAAAQGQGSVNRSQSSDSSSTTDMEQKRKHMRGKELLTAGLATIATIHAAHGVYSSMEAHEKRHKLVAEGRLSPEDARKKQTKAWVQDAAAVGIAALGIKGAFSEWKEMNEHRREVHEIEKRKRERRKKQENKAKLEEREQRERMQALMMQHPMAMYGMQNGMPMMPYGTHGGYGAQQQTGGAQQAAGPPPDNSGNPYAAASAR
ncbi:hypothetical protein EJ03DRAFT_51836 [Teratosphaeria nubilosa]|uniref:DUF3824 domain-containing protein n=1 Tax=Teratosphaeria nubilosa TaxID=161662 RepID=A0A6G1LEJ0_9PEZI|nr:hypothetical protein EJ03DRAFT_51836 [Teratosphaeria nubilosa]